MKRNALLLLPLLLCLCTLHTVAQPVAQFDRTSFDFGSILWKKPVTATFTLTNRGDKPLVITHVSTDCGCTEAEWTKEAIPVGGKGTVSATFDAAMLGRFRKSVGVYSNASDVPEYLTLSGTVATELQNYEEEYPYLIGNLRLDRRTIDFADGHKGDTLVAEVNIVNVGEEPIEPQLIHLPSHIRLEAQPAQLARKQAGKLRFFIDSERLTQLGLTQTSVYLARYMGDKTSEENELRLNAVLLPDFSRLTASQRALASGVNISTDKVDFGSFGTKKKLVQTIILTNTGKSPLHIQAIQVDDLVVGIDLKKNILRPGERTKLKITAVKSQLKKRKEAHARILMITNAPDHPKVVIEAKVTK